MSVINYLYHEIFITYILCPQFVYIIVIHIFYINFRYVKAAIYLVYVNYKLYKSSLIILQFSVKDLSR